MTSLPRRFKRNATAGYLYAFSSLALGVLVTPIVVRGLGKDAYGVWVLVSSSAVYFSLLKFGLGRATVKYVAEARARQDNDLVRRTVSTAFIVLSIPGLALLAASPGLALLFPKIFHVPPGLRQGAMVLVVLSSLDLGVAIPADTFGSALTGFQRYDLLNATLVATACAQAAAWTIILAFGGGLIEIGIATVAFSLTSQVVRYTMVRRLTGGPVLTWRFFDRSLVKPLLTVSGWIAGTDVGGVIIYRIDPIVVSLVAGVPQAGIYAVGQKLAGLIGQLTGPALGMFYPHSSELAATDDRNALRAGLFAGTRISVAIAAPLALTLSLLARPAIHVWVGSGFGQATQVVIYLSVAPLVGGAVTQTGIYVLRGSGDVRVPALITALEATLNLTLSIVLGLSMGLVGVALATLIAHASTQFVFLLPYICRRVQVSMLSLLFTLARAHVPPAALSAAVGLYLRRYDLDGILPLLGAGAAMVTTYALVFSVTGFAHAERQRATAVLRQAVRRA